MRAGKRFLSRRPSSTQVVRFLWPYIDAGLQLDRVTTCWDGIRNATRAIVGDIPLPKRSKEVEIVISTTEVKTDKVGCSAGRLLQIRSSMWRMSAAI
jgi:hypothetical protein